MDRLTCSFNQIVTLDLSHNPLLYWVLVDSNNLSNLNIQNGNNENFDLMRAGNNPFLECIQVDDLEYANSQICDWPASGWCKDWESQYSEECVLGITNSDLDKINIYPNPVQNTLNIITEFPIDNIKIYTLQGQLINETTNNKIDVSLLSSGLYFVAIIIDDKISVKKFIKN